MQVDSRTCWIVKLILAAVFIALTAFLMLGPLSATALPPLVTGIAEAGGWGATAVAAALKWILVIIDLVGVAVLSLTDWIDLLLCKIGITSCCERGKTPFWRLFFERMEKSNGKLTPQDVTDLKKRTNTLKIDGRITDAEKAELDAIVDKNAGP